MLSSLFLVLTLLAVFGQVYGHEFLTWDDEHHVAYNPRLNPVTWRSVGEFWTEPYLGLYIPLSYTFFAAETSIARQPPDETGCTLNPAVFHLGNLALHVACALLVFTILRDLFRHDGAACVGALLFGLHPVQVESVAWISETRGLLCALFSLLAIWQYLRHAKTSAGIVHYILATAAFILALLSKPAAVAVPMIVGVLELGLLRRPLRRTLGYLCPWLVMSAGCVVWTKFQQPDIVFSDVAPLCARPLLAGDALAFYTYKLVAPLQLGPDYGRTPAWVMQQWWLFYGAWLLPVVIVAAAACLRNRRIWLVACGVSIAWLLPVLGLVSFDFQQISTVADRYLYLALLGPALALSWFLAHRWNCWTIGITTAVLCLLGALSFIQTSQWRNNAALWTHSLEVNPGSVVANHSYGLVLARQERYAEAIPYYQKVLEVNPRRADTHLNLGITLFVVGNGHQSEEHLREALLLQPDWPIAHYNLGKVALFGRHDLDTAIVHYRAALEGDPNYIQAHVDLATALFEQGNVVGAIYHYRKALKLVPSKSNLAQQIRRMLQRCQPPNPRTTS